MKKGHGVECVVWKVDLAVEVGWPWEVDGVEEVDDRG